MQDTVTARWTHVRNVAGALMAASVALLSAQGASDGDTISPREAIRLADDAEAIRGKTNLVRGIVTYVSGIETNRFVIAPQEQTKLQGLTVCALPGVAVPRVGDLVVAEGQIRLSNFRPTLSAAHVDVIRHGQPAAAMGAKQSDYRRGILVGRLIELEGTVHGVRPVKASRGAVTRLQLYMQNYTTVVRVPTALDAERYLNEPIRVRGVACSVFNPKGRFLDSELEVAHPNDIEFLRIERIPRILITLGFILAAVLVLVSGTFLVLWLRGRRERRELEVIAAERRRMAADLHDTIEQHLAGASLIAAGVRTTEGVSDDVREAMATLASILSNAKAEVRSAVLNLRSAGGAARTLAETIGDLVTALEKTGVRARRCLRGLPAEVSEGLYHDLVLILREATTNAVKHGKAGQIVYTSDPIADGGFVLRVLNDGAPFDVDRALGPETGHYGLSGMRERALRNRLSVAWGREGRWSYMELKSEGVKQ